MRQFDKNKIDDQIGKRYGELTVVSYSHNKVTRTATKYHYNAVCSCGINKIVNIHSLISGDIATCGHSKSNRDPNKLYILTSTQVKTKLAKNYRSSVTRSTKKNKAFDLTLDRYITLVTTEQCKYCGDLPNPYHGIDRIDSNIGYIESNIVVACMTCNTMKSSLPEDVFLSHVAKIHKHTSQNAQEAPCAPFSGILDLNPSPNT